MGFCLKKCKLSSPTFTFLLSLKLALLGKMQTLISGKRASKVLSIIRESAFWFYFKPVSMDSPSFCQKRHLFSRHYIFFIISRGFQAVFPVFQQKQAAFIRWLSRLFTVSGCIFSLIFICLPDFFDFPCIVLSNFKLYLSCY